MDVSEDGLLAFLRPVVLAHVNATKTAEGGMDVDTPTGMTPLRDALALCINYKTSAPQLRLAFRKRLPEAENAIVVLEVLDEWLQELASRHTVLLPKEKTKGKAHKTNDTVPPLDRVRSVRLTPPQFPDISTRSPTSSAAP